MVSVIVSPAQTAPYSLPPVICIFTEDSATVLLLSTTIATHSATLTMPTIVICQL